MTYFQADDEYFYPIAKIKRFRMSFPDDDQVLHVELEGQPNTLTVKGRGVDLVLRASSQAVPADPGTMFVGLSEGEGESTIWFQPVIAWLIQLDREPLPVTVHGIEAGVANRYVIRNPDGSVSDWGNGDHPTLTAWLEEIAFSPQEIEAALQEETRAITRRLA